MKIVHEVEIDLREPWWKRRSKRLLHRRSSVLLWYGLFLLGIGVLAFLSWSDGEGVPTWTVVLTLAVTAFVVMFVLRSVRLVAATRRQLGDVVTAFVEFDAVGVVQPAVGGARDAVEGGSHGDGHRRVPADCAIHRSAAAAGRAGPLLVDASPEPARCLSRLRARADG